MGRPFLAVIASIVLLAVPSPLLGQAPERRAERAQQILANQRSAF